jgi:hypothetical protein
VFVDQTHNDFLPGSRLPQDENLGVRSSGSLDLSPERGDRGALTKEKGKIAGCSG